MRIKILVSKLAAKGFQGISGNYSATYTKVNGQKISILDTGQKIRVNGKEHIHIIFFENDKELNLKKYLYDDNEYLLMGVKTKFKNGKKMNCPEICAKILKDRGVLPNKPLNSDRIDHTNIKIPEKESFREILNKFKENNLNIGALWTYLVARHYQYRTEELVFKLCKAKESTKDTKSIFLESPLYPTRDFKIFNWNSKPDLSVGCFKIFKNTVRQLKSDGDWICVAESKWFDEFLEIKLGEFDRNPNLPAINQFTKLIEHALLLHGKNDNFPKRIYVTLITPKYFKHNFSIKPEKNYRYIFDNYNRDKALLMEDLKRCTAPFLNSKHNFKILNNRVNNLILNWVTFDELLGLKNLVINNNHNNIPKTNRNSWKQIFRELNRENLIEELLSEY